MFLLFFSKNSFYAFEFSQTVKQQSLDIGGKYHKNSPRHCTAKLNTSQYQSHLSRRSSRSSEKYKFVNVLMKVWQRKQNYTVLEWSSRGQLRTSVCSSKLPLHYTFSFRPADTKCRPSLGFHSDLITITLSPFRGAHLRRRGKRAVHLIAWTRNENGCKKARLTFVTVFARWRNSQDAGVVRPGSRCTLLIACLIVTTSLVSTLNESRDKAERLETLVIKEISCSKLRKKRSRAE